MHPLTKECFCGRCVERDEDADAPCATNVIGGEPLQYLGSAGDAAPFWDALTTYLAYPFRWQVLIFWLPLLVIAGALLASGGPSLWVGLGVATVGITQLGFAVTTVTGDGQSLDRLQAAVFNLKPEALLAQVLAQSLPLALSVAAAMYATGIVTHLAFLAAVLLLPALMLVALVDQSTGGLLVPQRWLEMIAGVGWSYGLIVGFVVLLAGVNGIAFSLFYGELPDALALPLLLAVLLYSMLVFFRLLGGVVHQFQRGIGFLPAGKPTRRRGRQAVDRTDQMIDMLVKDARFEDLEKYLRQLTKQRAQSPRYQDLLGKLLAEKGDDLALRQHADKLLEALVKSDDLGRLLFVYGNQIAILKDYRPGSPGVRFALAKLLAERGDHEAAARMLINMHNDHPQYPSLGDAYWFLSRLLAEELGQPELAAQCAMFVYKTFPKQAEREAIEQFLKGWKRGLSEPG